MPVSHLRALHRWEQADVAKVIDLLLPFGLSLLLGIDVADALSFAAPSSMSAFSH